MARRARHEIRNITIERRKDLRARQRLLDWRQFHRSFWETIDRHYERKGRTLLELVRAIWATPEEYRQSREPWFRQFYRAYLDAIEQYWRKRALPLLMAHALVTWGWAYYRGRAAFLFVTRNEHGKWDLVSETLKERFVLEQVPPEQWTELARSIYTHISQKGNLLADIPPILHLLLLHYVGLYHREPCKHTAVDIKITPWSMLTLTGRPMYGYTVRWTYRNYISDTDTVRRTRPVDLRIQGSLIRKPRHRIFKGKLPSNESPELSFQDRAYMGRNNLGQPTLGVRLLYGTALPHLMKKEFARQVGMAEASINTGHCSIYALPLQRARKSRRINVHYMRRVGQYYAQRRHALNYECYWQAKLRSLPFLPDDLVDFPPV